MKLTEAEIQHLKKRTNTELVLSDPKPVLDDLGIWYKELGNTSYQLNVRNERTPSAYISLKNGKWNYKDFGNGSNGNIVNVVMDYAQLPFKEALNYSLQKMGIPNYLSDALSNQNATNIKIPQETRERLKELRESNKEREKSTAISKVVSTYEVETNQLAVDYLKSRGIEKIPPNFKVINGEYTNKHGEVKRAYGVGILTQNGGADIHFLKKIGDLKTMTFGEKDITFLKKENSNKVAIFESKMDYASAYQQMPINDVNVIIANSTSNAHKVAELLKQQGLDNVMFFNQNDLAGYKFVIDISKEAGINDFKNIQYDVIEEYKKDVNDLLINDKKIANRIETSELLKFEKIYNSLEVLKNIQKDLEKPRITRDDLKHANNVNVNQSTEQDKGYER